MLVATVFFYAFFSLNAELEKDVKRVREREELLTKVSFFRFCS